MSDGTIHPEDPLFLVSRGLDGDLSERERRRLQELLAESPAIREEARKLEAVGAAVRRWGREGVEIDWNHQVDLVLASLDDADESSLREVDRLLGQWAERTPRFDEKAFAPAVIRRIAEERHGGLPREWVLRLGAPLAAAAAILLTVTATLWRAPTSEPVSIVAIGPAAVGFAGSDIMESRVVVSFGRRGESTAQGSADALQIGCMTLGASPLPRGWDEAAPL